MPEVGEDDLDLCLRKDGIDPDGAGDVVIGLEVPGSVSLVLVANGSKVPRGLGVGWLLIGFRRALEDLPKFWMPASTTDLSDWFDELVMLPS